MLLLLCILHHPVLHAFTIGPSIFIPSTQRQAFSTCISSNNPIQSSLILKSTASSKSISNCELISSTATPALPVITDEEESIKRTVGAAFYNRLMELRHYKLQNNNSTLVPKRYTPNPQLGNWVNKQRQQYRLFHQGKKSSMNDERIQILNREGFIWNASISKKNNSYVIPMDAKEDLSRWEKLWNTRFQELIEYKNTYGDCLVPINYESNLQLANWVSNQRKSYNLLLNGKKSSLTKKRFQMLEDIGFTWKVWDWGEF